MGMGRLVQSERDIGQKFGHTFSLNDKFTKLLTGLVGATLFLAGTSTVLESLKVAGQLQQLTTSK